MQLDIVGAQVDHVAIEHVAEMDADQRREHVEGDLLRGASTHARRAGNDFRRRLQQDGDIRVLEEGRTRIVGDGDHLGAELAGFVGCGQRIGCRPAGRHRDQTVARGDTGLAYVFARQIHVVFVTAGKVAEAGGAACKQNDDLVLGDAVGAGQFQRIGHGHQTRTAGAGIGEPVACAKRFSSQGCSGGNLLDRSVHDLCCRLLPGCEQPKREGWMHDIQAFGIVVTLLGLH